MSVREEKIRLRQTMRRTLSALTLRADFGSRSNAAVEMLRERLAGEHSHRGDGQRARLPVEVLRERFAEASGTRNLFLYLNLPDEFPTTPLLPELFGLLPELEHLLVPWCDGDVLRPFLLARRRADAPPPTANEFLPRLTPGAFGILEPRDELRSEKNFAFDPQKIDTVILPGLAFDEQGGRLGRGKGFFDRFLATLSPTCRLIGLAFREQRVEQVPREPHDRLVHEILWA